MSVPTTRLKRRLWVMLKEPTPQQGISFRFVRLLPRIFGVEICAIWSDDDH